TTSALRLQMQSSQPNPSTAQTKSGEVRDQRRACLVMRGAPSDHHREPSQPRRETLRLTPDVVAGMELRSPLRTPPHVAPGVIALPRHEADQLPTRRSLQRPRIRPSEAVMQRQLQPPERGAYRQ